MNTRPIIAFLLLFELLLCMPCIEAKQYYRPNQSRYNKKVVASRNKYNQKVIWMKKPGEGGLYTTKNYFISHGVGVTAAAMYYFGDVDNEGLAFHGGFNMHNLSLGAGLTFMYNLPAGNHCNMRFALLGGKIGGNNELKFNSLNPPRDDYRSFSAFVIAPSVGVQYYPFSNAGLFLYGGVSAAISIIDKYQFYRYVSKPGYSDKVREPLEGKTYGILPMIQLGFGYSWKLTASFSLSAEVMVQEGLVDAHYMNLDAYPLAKSQNNAHVEMGGIMGTYTDRYGKKRLRWNDGWFQAGLTLTYHWRNCEYCRFQGNYHNYRPKRR